MKWNTILYGLLFSGLGIFSYFLLISSEEFTTNVATVLYSKGAFIFFIVAFNILGYSTIRLGSWMNNQYDLNIRKRKKIVFIYLAVVLSFLFLNYSLLVVAKILVGIQNPFIFPNGGWRILIVVCMAELVIVGLLLSNRFIQNTLNLQQKAAELQKENNIARYAALQSQLNPHFLFNSLNTLIAEIEYNPANAVKFTKNLSNVYRYVLQCQEKNLVTLGEELEFIRSYLFLHEVRLGQCIECEYNISTKDSELLLPPLTLQLLVENVIKHNSISMSHPMKINISITGYYLTICNGSRPKKSSEKGGVGLENLSNRCKLMSGEGILIDKSDNFFKVKVPLLYE